MRCGLDRLARAEHGWRVSRLHVLSTSLVFAIGCDTASDLRCRPDTCAAAERCVLAAQAVSCEAVCMAPTAPRLGLLPIGTTLSFPPGTLVATTTGDETTVPPEDWAELSALTLTAPGRTTVLLRWRNPPEVCLSAPLFRTTYTVVTELPGTPEAPDAFDAVPMDDPRLIAWASDWLKPVRYGADVDPAWRAPERALGPATGAWDDAVSLGNGGSLSLVFDEPIALHPGIDFAVFENGFASAFLELAFVEVSSDGVSYARFPTLSIQHTPVAAYGTVDAREVLGLAGRYAGGYGTGFDLAALVDDPMVVTALVDLSAVRFVRIVDLVGDGLTTDSFGAPLYDPTPTFGSAGFDLEAIGVVGPE